EHARAAQHRRPADRRRAAAPVPHRLRVEWLARLASARRSRAEEGSHRSSPEWVHRGAITPVRLGGVETMVRKLFVVGPVGALASGGATACASKKFVRTAVGEVNEKVDSQGRAIEETQERVRRNEGRISEVDQRAASAAQSAQQANDSATAANNAASAAH